MPNGFQWNTNAAKVTLGSNFLVANTVWTLVNWDAESFDNNSMHSTSSNTSRVLAPVAGKYLAVVQVNWTLDSGVNNRAVYLSQNSGGSFGSGTVLSSETRAVIGGFGLLNYCVVPLTMAANDYVEAFVYNDSGGNDHISTTASFLALAYIGN
jgi:hypothetical protein